ncbi:hypothetical protein LOH54_10635 [Sulfurimonas sp. HSL-3221]|uniref:hypothetical protein n=1 Tax=Sulfurimonadaceae TaxID=2771471 RepID=UPI001E4AAFB6|nr:hypothetical protein [Sulfurimonas sp. HSL-3221]UFS62103.1 hypothetical protein LOH54_10635 [Sulfurimonas sp. HSL-3221]
MAKLLAWLQYLRTLVLAFRVIAFEKIDEAAFVVWGALTIFVAAVAFTYTVAAGGVALLGMVTLWFGVRGWARKNRCRLIRTADRVEFADVDTAADDYRQGFSTGVVLRRMETEDVKRTGEYDEALMAESRWFYVVSAPKKTLIVPCDRIVGIEIDVEGDSVWDH